MKTISAYCNDALHYFFPHLCMGCGNDVIGKDALICAQCIINLPSTNYAEITNNPIEKIFWGRLPLAAAHAQFYFAKSTTIQHLIHQLKYKNNQAIGVYLGELMGNSLLQSNRFEQIDYLIPLPLTAKREKKRGYNQAAIICKGMSNSMKVPIVNDVLLRSMFTQTQTKKQRDERWQNVSESFTITNQQTIEGKKILLVDDVITTGATLEAAGAKLLNNSNATLYLATLAFATKS
jgi:ComF family protein